MNFARQTGEYARDTVAAWRFEPGRHGRRQAAMRIVRWSLILVVFAGCAKRMPSPVAPPFREYEDLQAGQTLRVITPLWRSRGQEFADPAVTRQRADGRLETTVDTKGNFLGYEEAIYVVKPGLRIGLQRVESVIDGVRTPQSTPRVPLFGLPKPSRHVRLVYLLRSSEADHNMAILAAPDPGTLERLTEALRTNPATACPTPRCSWVPAGIAVRSDH